MRIHLVVDIHHSCLSMILLYQLLHNFRLTKVNFVLCKQHGRLIIHMITPQGCISQIIILIQNFQHLLQMMPMLMSLSMLLLRDRLLSFKEQARQTKTSNEYECFVAQRAIIFLNIMQPELICILYGLSQKGCGSLFTYLNQNSQYQLCMVFRFLRMSYKSL